MVARTDDPTSGRGASSPWVVRVDIGGGAVLTKEFLLGFLRHSLPANVFFVIATAQRSERSHACCHATTYCSSYITSDEGG